MKLGKSRGLYILDAAGNPQPEPDLIKWAMWQEEFHEQCKVAHDTLANGVSVSTRFIGIDHDHFRTGDPILWETMIFDQNRKPLKQRRYSSRVEAEVGHIMDVESASHITITKTN